jgi:hypothetical protein
MDPKMFAQMQAAWVAKGNIVRMEAQLDREFDPGKRQALEKLLMEQRKLVVSR